MIVHFACKDTATIFEGAAVKRLPKDLQIAASRKLQAIHVAASIADLQSIPGLRCKKLTGKFKDFWSIRVNDQWRIIFTWTEPPPEALNVQLTDYH
ncbi:MAG: type II toxin-antitoxin system RelE/ParE family toxin [Verrucomicrobiaceae bacterium]|nr:type II toxin-antitoxin system RelE/ParE family toxin [Verrucomicrobiaceae bacterium]